VVLHSNLSQTIRIKSLKEFHDGTKRILIATDIVARGLDISDVSHVINFDAPETPEDYIHRIGRTGRAKKVGAAFTFINEAEQEKLEAFETLMKIKIPVEAIPEKVVISKMLTDDETPKIVDRIKQKKGKDKYVPGPAFHEKKEKNKKVNLGGPGEREKLKGKDAKIRTFRRN
jgi:ATP-dependent RNA helicase RhlE